MNISIRKHIIKNFKDLDEKDIKSSIEDSIDDEEEVTLPGLGVFFELLWKGSTEEEKKNIIQILHTNIKST